MVWIIPVDRVVSDVIYVDGLDYSSRSRCVRRVNAAIPGIEQDDATNLKALRAL